MTTQDLDREDLTPAQMTRLRVELQQHHGMTEAQAAEAVDLLASMAGRLPAMEHEVKRMLADMANMRTALTLIEADLAAMAERRRRRA